MCKKLKNNMVKCDLRIFEKKKRWKNAKGEQLHLEIFRAATLIYYWFVFGNTECKTLKTGTRSYSK